MERIRWIEGLRGLAAFSVCFNHLMNGEIQAPYRSFWDKPQHENRKLVQLPPICLLFAFKAMVPLFMVLGGYAISHGLIHLRECSGAAALCRRVQSVVIRRFVRLYLSVLLLAVVTQVIFFFGLFNWDFEAMGVLRGRKPWTRPASHLTYALGFVVDLMDIVEFQFTQGCSNQIWTIPYEFRGSLVVCLLTIIFCAWKTLLRLTVLVVISLHLLWYGHWDIFCFVAGLVLAEARAAFTRVAVQRRKYGSWHLVLLLTGLYLICLRGETGLSPEYGFLAQLQSPHWTKHNPWIDVQYSWHAIGALMVVGAVSNSASCQRQLERRLPQYLGKLSFAMYLVHEVVYRMWRNPLRDFFWSQYRGGSYPGTDSAYQDVVPFLAAWVGAGLTIGLITILVAEVYRAVDRRIVAVAKALDAWATLGHNEAITLTGKLK